MRLRVVLVSLVLAAAAAPAHAGPRIVGGVPASAQDLPFMANFQVALVGVGDDAPDLSCGAVHIAARWVMTAAHCLPASPAIDPAHSFVVIGATDLTAFTPDQRYAYEASFVPRGYDTRADGTLDAGIVQIDRAAPGAQLRLFGPFEGAYRPGSTAYTAGWGLTDDPADGGTGSEHQLRVVDLKLVADRACQAAVDAVGGPKLDVSAEVCAAATGKDACNGYSGGPLFAADDGGLPALLGVVERGFHSADPARADHYCAEGPPGVYAWVAGGPLRGFVLENVPHVGLEPSLVPVAGERIDMVAAPSDPYAKGRFHGYDHLAWDLDGDGRFTERVGARRVPLTVGAQPKLIAVRAWNDTGGDDEVTRRAIKGQPFSAVSFARAKQHVRRGHIAKVRINRLGRGAGSVYIHSTAYTYPGTLVRFTGHERFRIARVRVPEIDNTLYRLEMRRLRGRVVAGTRTETELLLGHR